MNRQKPLNLPVALIIMDGYGLGPSGDGNAIDRAATPVLDRIFGTCPHIELAASGKAVGLPAGQMGNSEVGHLNIGAGRVVFQELTRIDDACADGTLKQNGRLVEACERACRPGAALHLMGLLSDGGVHSSNRHLETLIRMAVERGVPDVRLHCFMDGRDVPPMSGAAFIDELEGFISSLETPRTSVSISSIEGRYFAMDRDNRWDRVERAYDAIVRGIPETALLPGEVVRGSYADGVTDEFMEPVSLDGRGVRSSDAVVFFNFRPDRARQMTRAFVEPAFSGFERGPAPDVFFVCMTEYDPSLPAAVAFPKEFPAMVLADVLAQAGLRQYHIAETEKYAHVTFFLNGGREEPKEGEMRKLIASPRVATYDLKPEMSEPQVADALCSAIAADEADVYIVNFANCDMVGHTGDVDAAMEAVEAVDEGVGRVLDALKEKGGIALLTADHGNADKMLSDDGGAFTAHTTAPVPLALIDFSGRGEILHDRPDAALCDVAPTLLSIIGLEPPQEMTGRDLLHG